MNKLYTASIESDRNHKGRVLCKAVNLDALQAKLTETADEMQEDEEYTITLWREY